MLTLPQHMSSHPVFSWVRVTRTLVLCVCFVDRRLSFCPFSFGHCVVCYANSDYPFGIFKLFLQDRGKLQIGEKVTLVEQELPTIPEHLGSSRVLVVFVLLDLQIYVYVLLFVVCPFALFRLAIVLSVLLFTDSNYSFGIFKLFLQSHDWPNNQDYISTKNKLNSK